jgi:hypothetical protein
MQNQSDAIATIQQAAQLASSINTTAVPSPSKLLALLGFGNFPNLATNAIAAAANLNHLAQVAAMQTQPETMVSIQQAAQIASVQSPSRDLE